MNRERIRIQVTGETPSPDAVDAVPVKRLTVPGVTANNKTYNGNTSAALNTGSAALAGVAANRFYDGTTSASLRTGSGALVGVVRGDTLTPHTSATKCSSRFYCRMIYF